LIQDCDISGAIATCLPDGEIDMQFGVGGAPEAVITKAAIEVFERISRRPIAKDIP
jgi:fructose-1,6-bisphosphatase II